MRNAASPAHFLAMSPYAARQLCYKSERTTKVVFTLTQHSAFYL